MDTFIIYFFIFKSIVFAILTAFSGADYYITKSFRNNMFVESFLCFCLELFIIWSII